METESSLRNVVLELNNKRVFTVQKVNSCTNMGVIAKAASRRLPTATVRVRCQFRPCEICVGHSGIEAGFLRVLRFPLPILIAPAVPCSATTRSWGSRPNMPSGFSLSPLHELKNWAREHVNRTKIEGEARKGRSSGKNEVKSVKRKKTQEFGWKSKQDFYVSGHYPSSYLYLKTPSSLFFKTQRFGDWILSPTSGKPNSVGPNR
jgi:hypothetical protein